MCDYCDCRSHPQISTLSDEHEEILGVLHSLTTALGDPHADRPSDLLDQLHDLLHDHTIREESGVFTELRNADVDEQYVSRFQADHDAVHVLLGAGDDDWRPTVAALVHLLEEHIEREETDLFPAAHQLLTPAQWDDVSTATSRSLTPVTSAASGL
jgi:hemerythrin-like domain-containing protein